MRYYTRLYMNTRYNNDGVCVYCRRADRKAKTDEIRKKYGGSFFLLLFFYLKVYRAISDSLESKKKTLHCIVLTT